LGNLFDDFSNMLQVIGMDSLKHPIFYNAPIAIRFEIGGEESVYLNNTTSDKFTVNPAYVSAALNRVKSIYEKLPHTPNILRIDVYPDEENSVQEIIQCICKVLEMQQPHEQVSGVFQWDEDSEAIPQLQLYWDLTSITFSPDVLLQEITKADIGGYSTLVSSVYFADTNDSILFHIYDDRGADLVAGNKDLLRPIYEQFNSWVLDYDRDRINETFVK